MTLAWAVSRARTWAWWILVALHGANAAYLLLSAASMNDATAGRNLIWPAVYLVVLTSERTRAWFGITYCNGPGASETDRRRDSLPKT
jgi:NhaP-type Na+/H+ or K+/H+ antiporter